MCWWQFGAGIRAVLHYGHSVDFWDFGLATSPARTARSAGIFHGRQLSERTARTVRIHHLHHSASDGDALFGVAIEGRSDANQETRQQSLLLFGNVAFTCYGHRFRFNRHLIVRWQQPTGDSFAFRQFWHGRLMRNTLPPPFPVTWSSTSQSNKRHISHCEAKMYHFFKKKSVSFITNRLMSIF